MTRAEHISEQDRPEQPRLTPTIIPRSEHGISRANISENALKVLYRLKEAGYAAYLVGGGVRDLLLGREPKDFDVATDARPDQVRELFRNCRLIGRRFRLAHVFFGRDIVEVATFRALLDAAGEDEEPGESGDSAPGERLLEDGRILRDNVYGSIDEDAWRRDFSINALYYDIRDFSLVDYAGGLEDLRNGLLRLIGEPEVRYREDPVRMLRAVRFAAKLGFRLESRTEEALQRMAPLLHEISAARLFDEVVKLFHGGYALASFEALRHYGLFEPLFPMTEEVLEHEEEGFPITFVSNALQNTDVRVAEGKPVTPAFLFAAMLWEPVRERAAALQASGMTDVEALQEASGQILAEQQQYTSIPKRFGIPMREIWTLQPRFTRRRGKTPQRLMGHPRFRAAYDFLCLRARSGEALEEDCDWWTRAQEGGAAERAQAQAQESEGDAPRKRPRRRRRRRRPGGENKGGGSPKS